MTPAPVSSAATQTMSWIGRAEAWLDDRGKPAWIVAMVLAFVVFWPIGLALLAYMIWSKRMFSGKCASARTYRHSAYSSSGNAAFDAYKAETLRRLEDEQDAFRAFLERLRAAKDQAEFDAFMDERTKTRATRGDDRGGDDGGNGTRTPESA